jgi:hypothetical protein
MENHLQKIIDQAETYNQRQAEIDQLLTPFVVKEIVLENLDQIKPHLLEQHNRLVILTFASTQALLRRLQRTIMEKPISIDSTTIEKGRLMHPASRVIKNCQPETQFCVMIVTLLPLSALGLGKDGMLTHTTTGFLLSSFIN